MIDIKIVHRHLAADNQWYEKIQWCEENLHHGGHYEPKWRHSYPWIEFEDEKEYAWFKLRWE